MEFHIYWLGSIVTAIVGMMPGAIIYAPQVLGKAWAKETGRDFSKIDRKEGNKAMVKMLVTTFITAIFMSAVFWYMHPTNAGYGLLDGLILSWFPISFLAGAVFFEGRSWKWFQISTLTQVTTFGVMGLVLSLFVS